MKPPKETSAKVEEWKCEDCEIEFYTKTEDPPCFCPFCGGEDITDSFFYEIVQIKL